MNKIVRGQIVWIDFGKGEGSEQGGIRPAIVVQNDIGNYYSPCIIVVPLTKSDTKAKIPTQVELVMKNIWGIALGEQIRTLSKKRIREITDTVIQDMSLIDDALRTSLAL